MKTTTSATILSLFGLIFALSLPAQASVQGQVSSIELLDRNQNGKLDHAVIEIQNPEHRTWSVGSASALTLYYADSPLETDRVYFATAPGANPMKLTLKLDETSPNLPPLTTANLFELEYLQKGVAQGINDGTVELQVIPRGDSDASNTEIDAASPVLLSTSPIPGQYGLLRTVPITLHFSEPIDTSAFAFISSANPGGWNFDWTDENRTVTIDHTPYKLNLTESFTVIAAPDETGNALVAGSHPNPFSFRIANDASPNSFPDHPDPVSVITSPPALSTLMIGSPNILNWYTNQDEIVSAKLLYSKDGGTSFQTIVELPRSQTSYTWYPPNLPGSLILRLEAENAQGIPLNIDTVNPLTLALPAFQPKPLALRGPAVSDLTDTTAKVSLSLDAPPAAVSLSCNGAQRTENITVKNGDLPTDLSVELSNLVTDSSYACSFKMTDLFGQESSVTVPSFIASSAGDTVAPKLVNQPVVHSFDAASRTAKVTWSTDEPSTAELNYGRLLNYSQLAKDTNLSKEHTVTLTDLHPGEFHQVRITSLDSELNGSVTEDVFFVFLKEGDLIKAKDSSAVYWYKDGKRMVFPNETIYGSWFSGFDTVITIPSYQLSKIPLGGNVKMKADTYLVKITSDPKTYAIEPDGTLRWIQTEFMANQLYGPAWNTIIRDVDVSLFVDYSIGNPLVDGEKPAGHTPRS